MKTFKIILISLVVAAISVVSFSSDSVASRPVAEFDKFQLVLDDCNSFLKKHASKVKKIYNQKVIAQSEFERGNKNVTYYTITADLKVKNFGHCKAVYYIYITSFVNRATGEVWARNSYSKGYIAVVGDKDDEKGYEEYLENSIKWTKIGERFL
jgi:hypothetical protein